MSLHSLTGAVLKKQVVREEGPSSLINCPGARETTKNTNNMGKERDNNIKRKKEPE